jgi:hypothetical protein
MIATKTYRLNALTGINAVFFWDQVRKGRNYYNKLVETERWRRDEERKVVGATGKVPELERESWTVSITIDDQRFATTNTDTPTVAFDLGWRKISGLP